MSGLAVEYRKIGLLPTCIGNERIRITADGRVSHSRNTQACKEGELWSNEWRNVGRLDTAAMNELAQEISQSGLLGLPPESIDETAEGGKREEMDVTLGEEIHHFVVQNTNPPEFRRVVTSLWGAVSSAEIGAC